VDSDDVFEVGKAFNGWSAKDFPVFAADPAGASMEFKEPFKIRVPRKKADKWDKLKVRVVARIQELGANGKLDNVPRDCILLELSREQIRNAAKDHSLNELKFPECPQYNVRFNVEQADLRLAFDVGWRVTATPSSP
jgi:hypothetical protein